MLLFVAPHHWGPVARMAGLYLGHVVVYGESEIVLLMLLVTNVLLLSLLTTITAIINSEPAIMVNIIVRRIFSKRTLVREK